MSAGGFFGGLLIVAGALLALLCGLCTLLVIGVSVEAPATSGGQNYGGGAMIPVALLLGGVPTVFGGLMIWAGIMLMRSGRKRPEPAKPETFE
ncbi:MAG TPA: hypothetical protein VFE13_02880 [Caulobacteraceae bacterium]|jgi:hypothetical protein|nr:hypothetical protein [Caulobacteraceae bacterium]